MTSQLHRLVVAAAVGAALSGCTSVVAGTIEPADLATALVVDVPGFTPSDAPAPPAVCREGSYSGELPSAAPDRAPDAAAGFTTEDAELGAWAWRFDSADEAAALIDAATAQIEACRFDIYYDSDTDGDGELDAGGHEQQQARAWSDDTWTGLAVNSQTQGNGYELTETRFVRSDDVVLLVVLTSSESGAESLPATVEGYLDGVAVLLG